MRQVGVLAAAALHALDHNVESLSSDHNRAKQLADALSALDVGKVEHNSNMVFFTPAPDHHAGFVKHTSEAGVITGAQFPTIRMVVHRDIDDESLNTAIQSFQSYYA